MKFEEGGRPATTRALPIAVALAMSACGGGGGGGEDPLEPEQEAPTISYSIGAPSTTYAQPPLSITVEGAAGARAAALSRKVPLALERKAPSELPSGTFVFPSGPDGAGDTLPKISGEYDRLTQTYTQGLATKLWIDLPASADGHPVALEVTRVLQPSTTFAAGDPVAGEVLLTRRQTTAEFAGRLRVSFSTSATPVCLAWDAARDGTYEVERCMSSAALAALWSTPDVALAIPQTVQRAAGASYTAWVGFMSQFEFGVAAMRMAAGQLDALQAAAPGAIAATVGCGIYPPTGTAGHYAISWGDRNGSGRFDKGDDVRFVASSCWNRLDEVGSGPGRSFDGALELRGYERDVGAAPTFIDLRVTDTDDVAGVVTPQSTQVVNGGFAVRAAGLMAEGDVVSSYLFDTGNMAAAGAVAARSMTFYPDIGDLAYQGLKAALASPATPQDLGLCGNAGNGGTSTMTFTEGPAPNPAGVSAGDKVRVVLADCDIGRGGSPKILDGSLEFSLWTLTRGPGTDWGYETDLKLDLQTTTSTGSTRRLGETGLKTAFVLGHSYYVWFQPQSYSPSASISGVLTAFKNGAADYQIGCYGANVVNGVPYYRGDWAWSDFQIMPNQVVKTANRVFTIGMRQGEAFTFKADALGNYTPDIAQAGMIPISAPECVALGVPSTGVSGGDNTMIFDAWPAGDGGRVRLQLNGTGGTMLEERWVDWLTLVR